MAAFRFDRWELGGALGDVGVLLPLAIALITLNGLNPTAVFLAVGVAYVSAGLYYRLPVPVQPLKAASALALALGLGAPVMAAAGFLMGAILLLVAGTGLVDRLARVFPRPLIRGIQLGIGLLLIKAGWGFMSGPLLGGGAAAVGAAAVGAGAAGSAGLPPGTGLILGVLVLLALVRFAPGRRVPVTLVVLGLGALTGAWLQDWHLFGLSLGPAGLTVGLPRASDLSVAFLSLVIPQLPLTLGNSVVATADVARSYFGEEARRVTPRALAGGLGLANLMTGLIQGMPVCHGAAGMTAHRNFGARSGGAPLMMGLFSLVLALGLGRGAVPLLSLIPLPVLGAFLVYVGLEHAALIADLQGRGDVLVGLGTGAVSLATGNMAYGLAAGLLMLAALRGKVAEVPAAAPAAASASASVSVVEGSSRVVC